MNQSTTPARTDKPEKPSSDFPLFPHATGRWAKKVGGKMLYFGPWADPGGALRAYQEFVATGTMKQRADRQQSGDKPAKPNADFPLFAHATGRWAKKIRGRLHYFGPWDDPQGSLVKYLAAKDDLHAGRTPKAMTGHLTINDLANQFLSAKRHLVSSNEITARTWADYFTSCGRMVKYFGGRRLVVDLNPDDFARYRTALAKKWGPTATGNEIQRVRSVFKYGFDTGIMDQPMRFGPGFKKPTKKTMRQQRAKKGLRMFEAAQLLKILDGVVPPMKTMVLLGINCGFGNRRP